MRPVRRPDYRPRSNSATETKRPTFLWCHLNNISGRRRRRCRSSGSQTQENLRERRRHTEEHDCPCTIGSRACVPRCRQEAPRPRCQEKCPAPRRSPSGQVSEHVALHRHEGSGKRNNCNHSGKPPGETEIMHGFIHSHGWQLRREGHAN